MTAPAVCACKGWRANDCPIHGPDTPAAPPEGERCLHEVGEGSGNRCTARRWHTDACRVLYAEEKYWERHAPAPAPVLMAKRDPLEYALNRMEAAAQSLQPAANGYGPARREVLDGIATLRADNTKLREENERLRDFLRRILAADMTGDEAGRNRASGEAALYLAARARGRR